MTPRGYVFAGVAACALAAAGVGVWLHKDASSREQASNTARTITVTDDVGRQVILPLPVRRTVVFNGATTELIRQIDALDTVVGVDAGSIKQRELWPTLNESMIVGQGQSAPNYEAIIAKKPDVVMFPRNGEWKHAAEVLKPFGIPVLVVTAWDLARNEFNIDLLGRIYERQKQAGDLKAYCQTYRDILADRLKGQKPKTVYLEQGEPYTTVLEGSGWHDMIVQAGAVNIFADIDIKDQPKARGTNQVFHVDPEEILRRRPQMIVKLQPEAFRPNPRAMSTQILGEIVDRPGFSQLPAVRDGQVHHLGRLMTHGCSKLIGSLQLAKWLYPHRFTDVEPWAEADRWLKMQGVRPPGGYAVSIGDLRK